MEKKKWWKSRTMILNGLAALAVLIQAATGNAWLNAELQASIIVIVNVVLRMVTKSGLEK